jgi:hypothetical protein
MCIANLIFVSSINLKKAVAVGFNALRTSVIIPTACFNIHKLRILPKECIYRIRMILKINIHYSRWQYSTSYFCIVDALPFPWYMPYSLVLFWWTCCFSWLSYWPTVCIQRRKETKQSLLGGLDPEVDMPDLKGLWNRRLSLFVQTEL